MTTIKPNGIWCYIKKKGLFLSVLTMAAGVLIGYGGLQADNINHKKELKELKIDVKESNAKLEEKIEETIKEVAKNGTQAAVIENEVKNVKETVDKIYIILLKNE